MLRGFLLGSLALIVFNALVSNQNAPVQAEAASRWGLRGFARLLSPDTAGVPQLKSAQSVPISPTMPGRKLRTTDTTPAPAPVPARGAITV